MNRHGQVASRPLLWALGAVILIAGSCKATPTLSPSQQYPDSTSQPTTGAVTPPPKPPATCPSAADKTRRGDFVCVAALGFLVGASELISRYKDSPVRALFSMGGMIYMLINAAAAAAALWLAIIFDWRFGVAADQSDIVLRIVRVFTTGLAAMAVFRSSLFVVRVGQQDVGFGPSGLLLIILRAADRQVDRHQGKTRLQFADEKAARINFATHGAAIVTYCLGALQNLSPDEQSALAATVAILKANTEISDVVKAKSLILQLLSIAGSDIVEKAIDMAKK
jgi:hypothetical protein